MIPRPRVLIIDDHHELLQALPELLRLRLPEVTVETSASAAVGLEQIRRTDYYAIVCDLKMPQMDGLALLREMKTVRPKTPVLLITGSPFTGSASLGDDEQALATLALHAGAYDFIHKPIDRGLFVLAMKRAIEAFELRQYHPPSTDASFDAAHK